MSHWHPLSTMGLGGTPSRGTVPETLFAWLVLYVLRYLIWGRGVLFPADGSACPHRRPLRRGAAGEGHRVGAKQARQHSQAKAAHSSSRWEPYLPAGG